MKKSQKLSPVDGKHVVLTDGFWSERLSVFEKVTIPDVFDKFERDRGGAFNNFKRVRDKKTGYHAGPPWYDGLIGECIRGASDFLGRNYDKALDERLDGYIKLIAEAQDASGDDYLNTYTTLICPEHRWGRDGGELLWQHDLYNTGCNTGRCCTVWKVLTMIWKTLWFRKNLRFSCDRPKPLPA